MGGAADDVTVLKQYGWGRTTLDREARDAALRLVVRALAAEAALATTRQALEQIASCEKRVDGDVVDIARRALAAAEEGE